MTSTQKQILKDLKTNGIVFSSNTRKNSAIYKLEKLGVITDVTFLGVEFMGTTREYSFSAKIV